MAVIKEIAYFNSFVIKKAVRSSSGNPTSATWPGLPWNPDGYPSFPMFADTTSVGELNGWYVEESRIRGGFNNKAVDLGVRAYLKGEDNRAKYIGNGLIYSGVYNTNTEFNETNVFSSGDNIVKQLDSRYGTIQRLYTSDTNLVIFQEDKVSRGLIDRDVIFTGDGNPNVTSSSLVLGQITPYAGEYGISTNPESLAEKGYRIYFSDKNRGAIMRLSMDGLTEISSYGMRDHFRDSLGDLSNVEKRYNIIEFSISGSPSGVTNNFDVICTSGADKVEYGMSVEAYNQAIPGMNGAYIEDFTILNPSTNLLNITLSKACDFTGLFTTDFQGFAIGKDLVVGGFDNYLDKYVVSMQNITTEDYETVTFSESSNGWTSFWDYDPSFLGTLNNVYYTCKDGSLWRHYDESLINQRNFFYGTKYKSSVEFIFNPNPSTSKVFKTINYEGSNGWEVPSIFGDERRYDNLGQEFKDSSNFIYSFEEGSYQEGGVTYRAGFNRKENKYMCNIINSSNERPGEVVFGDSMTGIKGYYVTVKMQTDDSTNEGGLKQLFAASTEFVYSAN